MAEWSTRENGDRPVNNHLLEAALAALGSGVAIALLVVVVRRPWQHSRVEHSESGKDSSTVWNATSTTLQVCVVAFGIAFVAATIWYALQWKENLTAATADERAPLTPPPNDSVGTAIDESVREAKADVNEHLLIDVGLSLLFLSCVVVLAALDVRRRREIAKLSETRQAALLQQQASLQAVFDTVQIGMVLCDEQLRITRINDALAKLVGKHTSELLGSLPGNGLLCLRATETPDGCGHAPACQDCPVRKAVKRALVDGETVRNEDALMQIVVEGTVKSCHFAVNATPLILDDRSQVLLTLTDIAHRKESEARLIEATNDATHRATQLRSMIEGMDAGVMVADANDTITDVNEWLLGKLGVGREEFIGRMIWDSRPRTLLTTDLRSTIGRFREKDCRETYVFSEKLHGAQLSCRAHPIFQENEYRGVIIIAVDVTDLVEARQVAEKASQAKSDFLANMSHEIRTPMTAILGFTDVLSQHLTGETEQEAVEIIRRNGTHLLEVINSILDISKIEAGGLCIERIECDPATILADVVSLMRIRADAKGVALKLEYDGPYPNTILSDPTRFRQILINLVGNAIKFTDAGEVRVISRLVNLNTTEALLECEIADSGLGMTHEQIERLFVPFQQADTSTTRKYGGTGLGLAISKRLAETLGGDIEVRSEPGKGSVFLLQLDPGNLEDVELLDRPNEVTRSQGATRASRDTESGRHRIEGHVLLAEDGLDNQRLIRLLLEKAGTEVTTVENGELAVNAAVAAHEAGTPFDIILMDMQMPVLDGYSATRRLRKAGYAGPVVALTANALVGDRTRCLDAGCDDYVPKPIDPHAFTALVADWVRKGHDASPA